VAATGFQKLVRTDVIVNTTERVHLDLTMQVGGVTETITVSGETPLLQSEKATVGQVVEQRAIESIPLATRNFTQLLGPLPACLAVSSTPIRRAPKPKR